MPSIRRPPSPTELAARSAKAEARVVRAAARAGWLAVGGGLASFPQAAILAPPCQPSARELLTHAEAHAQVPPVWRKRFEAAGVTLPDPCEGYICLIGKVRVR